MALADLSAAFEALAKDAFGESYYSTCRPDDVPLFEQLNADELGSCALRLYDMIERCLEQDTLASPASTSTLLNSPPAAPLCGDVGMDSVLIPSLVSNIPNIGFSIERFDDTSSDEGPEDHSDHTGHHGEFRLSRSASSRISVDGYEYINEFMVLDQIGRGQFGRVLMAVKDGESTPVAIKVVPRTVLKKCAPSETAGAADTTHPDLETLQHEVAVMKKLRHRNVVQLFECIDDAEEGNIYLVMQYVDKGPLFSLDSDGCCPVMDTALVRSYTRQIVSGLSYLERCGVLHMDIKPDNLLVNSDGNVFIADFGMSEVIEHTPENLGMLRSPDSSVVLSQSSARRRSIRPAGPTQRGTPAFMSPEMCLGVDDITAATDVWSLGVTVYCMLVGHLPFRAHSWRDTTKLIVEAEPFLPAELSPMWRELIGGMLDKDPRERMTLAQLRRHPALQGSRRASSMSSSFVGWGVASPRASPLDISPEELETAITALRGKPVVEQQPPQTRLLNLRGNHAHPAPTPPAMARQLTLTSPRPFGQRGTETLMTPPKFLAAGTIPMPPPESRTPPRDRHSMKA